MDRPASVPLAMSIVASALTTSFPRPSAPTMPAITAIDSASMMTVIAGMVGADGLGKEVVKALATIDIAKGTEAGLSIVFLAIFLDRVTAALGAPREEGSLLSFLKKR